VKVYPKPKFLALLDSHGEQRFSIVEFTNTSQTNVPAIENRALVFDPLAKLW
jgi:hypothetical protein